jgi:F420-0:gamma-glutamyl ligase
MTMAIYEDKWGKHAVVLMDTGSTRICEGLTTVGIGWYLLETAKA